MSEFYLPEVYDHLAIVAKAQEYGWLADGIEKDADFELLKEYCIGKGLTHDVPTGWMTVNYAEGECPIKPDGTTYYELTAEGQLTLRHRPTTADSQQAPNDTKPERETQKPSLDEQALGIFISRPELTKVEMAKILGCNEKSLAPARCPRLTAAIAAHKAQDPSQRKRRGTKDAQGNLEAWDEE